MKNSKLIILASLLSLPFIWLWYYLLIPPQCPLNYTQEQVDESRCIIGANIGGEPLFIAVAIISWLGSVWLVNKFGSRKGSK